ncbi:Uncharacterized conserved protein, tellurite resistance protein B (TerB) family [Alteromonadaceae bacterium Bs31]|nr:Uncharacterized conserved protein, tellurite resistance protein B (TerB) family [Alteromonadaceae bacterium Bs31]
MLSAIKDFFSQLQVEEEGGTSEQQRRLACAALLIEVAVIDQQFDPAELGALHQVLQHKFGLSAEECETLTTLAKAEREEASSLYQFTQLVNDSCSPAEKYQLIKGMWTIAYADGNLDKYEEYVVRKVAELIYVSHSDFIRAKLETRPG